MIHEKKATLHVTKVRAFNGVTRFNVMVTYSPSAIAKCKELWEQSYVLGDSKFQNEQENLVKEFHSFLIEAFEQFELYEVYNDRLNLSIKFGDEYKAWTSISGHKNEDESKLKGQAFYKSNGSSLNIPLTHDEILFFVKALEMWSIIAEW